MIVNFACFANLLLIPYVLTRGAGTWIAAAGLVLSFYPAGSVLGGMLGVAAGRPPGLARPDGAGPGAGGRAAAVTAGILAQAMPGLLGAGMLLCGLGQGLFQVGYMDTTATLLPAHERGVAGSLVNVTRGLGIVLGAAGIAPGLWRIEALTSGCSVRPWRWRP